jgi:putative nucleotidyltransferase with HDIG domain
MMTEQALERPGSRRLSPAKQAEALALVLREEFATDFTFYDAASGESVLTPPGERPAPAWEPDAVGAFAVAGRAGAEVLADGRFQIALPLCQAGQVTLVATAVLGAVTPPRAALEPERVRLQKWAQSVCDRLQLSEQLLGRRRADEEAEQQVKAAWKVTLTLDRLARGLRAHRQSPKGLQRILQGAFELLEVESLLWVPQAADAAVLVVGQGCLAPDDGRQLAPVLAAEADRQGEEPIFCPRVPDRPWGARFPSLRTLLAFPVADQGPLGWVIAVNKTGAAEREPRFRRSDAAVLTPFVALLQLQLRTATRYQNLQDLLVGLTRSLTTALDAKDSYTFGHSERVARIAVELARELGLKEEELSDLYLAGLLHDIGKIGVRDSVLAKKEPLTPEEFEHIKRHVTIGYAILADLRQIRNLLPVVLYHHERYDGKGYPDGLAGQAIPLMARILAVADAYDAMSTARPYRPALPCNKIEEIFTEGANKQWDGQVVAAFFRCRHRIYATRQRGVGESLRQALDGALTKDDGSVLWKSGQVPVGTPEFFAPTPARPA